MLRAGSSDIVFCWFASVYSFFAVVAGQIFGIKSIIVVGGVDVAKEEALGYGIWLSPWKSRLVRYALKNADKILVVDTSLKEQATRLAEYDGKNILCVPTGYDTSFWKPSGEKEQIVLTVAIARDRKTFLRKGIDQLIIAAMELPQIHFIIVGVDHQLIEDTLLPPNISFHSQVKREDLLPYYRRAKVYCQPSRFEGLPNSLCEAMSCGCIPVATEVGGNQTALGDSGFLVQPNDPIALSVALREAIISTNDNGAKARSRIVGLFPKEKRENELFRIIEKLTP